MLAAFLTELFSLSDNLQGHPYQSRLSFTLSMDRSLSLSRMNDKKGKTRSFVSSLDHFFLKNLEAAKHCVNILKNKTKVPKQMWFQVCINSINGNQQIRVTDNDPSHSPVTATVTVRVLNMNEFTPNFAKSQYTATVQEGSPPRTSVAAVSVSTGWYILFNTRVFLS